MNDCLNDKSPPSLTDDSGQDIRAARIGSQPAPPERTEPSGLACCLVYASRPGAWANPERPSRSAFRLRSRRSFQETNGTPHSEAFRTACSKST